MCGICGLLTPENGPVVDRALLESMSRALRHRGPDSQGAYLNGRIGLAMRRLAIIDRAGGDQPMYSEDGRLVLVFNGEIYNYRELGNELSGLGHRFRTNSDTEVILHAIEEWGDDALLRLNGMFAFSLWDEAKQRLLLARDRMGQKPLYYHHSASAFAWASEIKGLLEAPWISTEIDPIALHHYLSLQYVPDPLTIYQEIRQLPAAHKLVIEGGKGPEISRYWQLAFEPKWEAGEEDLLARSRELLRAAVRRRLISEVPLGAFLSGGIDSSILVGLMAESASGPVKTFSIGFQEEAYSETKYARRVAEHFGTDHHEYVFAPGDLVRVIEGVVRAMDQPFADPAALPLYELARQARQEVTVALCGDGGDETLGGYLRYALDGLVSPVSAGPAWLHEKLLPSLTGRLPEPAWLPEDRNPVTGLKRLGQAAGTTSKASILRWGSYFSHEEKIGLYAEDFRDRLLATHSETLLEAAYDAATARDPLDRTLSADHAFYLAGDLLPKTDRVTMAHALEARAPFLDPDWVAWSARLPVRYKVRGLQTKWLLRRAFRGFLPPDILRRGKQGFSLPVGLWLRNELSAWSRQVLYEDRQMSAWFRQEALDQLFRDHLSGQANHGKKLWSMIMLAVWMQSKDVATA